MKSNRGIWILLTAVFIFSMSACILVPDGGDHGHDHGGGYHEDRGHD